jgi:hypothetical protein
MKLTFAAAIGLFCAGHSQILLAHEVDTHAALGIKAWEQSSVVTDPIVRANLGLDRDVNGFWRISNT